MKWRSVAKGVLLADAKVGRTMGTKEHGAFVGRRA